MLRIVLGIIAGTIVGSIIFLVFQMFNGLIFPLPEGADYRNQEAMKDFVSGLPAVGFVLILIGYAVGSVGAGYIARKISRHASIVAPMILGLLFSIGWAMNISAIPHPLWVIVAGFAIYLPFTFFGHKLAAD